MSWIKKAGIAAIAAAAAVAPMAITHQRADAIPGYCNYQLRDDNLVLGYCSGKSGQFRMHLDCSLMPDPTSRWYNVEEIGSIRCGFGAKPRNVYFDRR